MANILLPILPGQMPAQFCFTTWQNLLNTISNAQNAVLPGEMFYNYGDTKPAPEYEAYPWLRTIDMKFYRYDGDWISPNPETSTDVLRLYLGSLASIATYDGGDTGTLSDRSGPMWEIAAEMTGRFPLGVGEIAGSDPAVTTAVGDNAGEAQHAITEAEGAVGAHVHGFGISNPASDDAFFARLGTNTVQGYTGYYITGSGPNTVAGQTTADLFTLPSGLDGKGVTSDPMKLIPPATAVYFLRRTSRTYYKV